MFQFNMIIIISFQNTFWKNKLVFIYVNRNKKICYITYFFLIEFHKYLKTNFVLLTNILNVYLFNSTTKQIKLIKKPEKLEKLFLIMIFKQSINIGVLSTDWIFSKISWKTDFLVLLTSLRNVNKCSWFCVRLIKSF